MASVLVVDDDDGTRDSYERFLHLAGYETATAATGRAGVDLALARTFDVHLIDLRLQDMSGVEVVRTLRLHRVGGRMVIVTALPTLDTAFAAAAAGADGYVAGPLFGDDVVDIVGRAIAGLVPVRTAVHSHGENFESVETVENIRALARRSCGFAQLGPDSPTPLGSVPPGAWTRTGLAARPSLNESAAGQMCRTGRGLSVARCQHVGLKHDTANHSTSNDNCPLTELAEALNVSRHYDSQHLAGYLARALANSVLDILEFIVAAELTNAPGDGGSSRERGVGVRRHCLRA